MSFKAIILLTRAEGATHEQFADWWLKQHAPLAKQLPNLRKGIFNLVENPVDGDPDANVRSGKHHPFVSLHEPPWPRHVCGA